MENGEENNSHDREKERHLKIKKSWMEVEDK